jgi:AbrB family looped-hinge helix DNA binding protein
VETSTLTSKGQLLIPKRLRTKYGIKSGVKVIFEETDDGLILKPMDAAYFAKFAGILSSTGNFKKEMKEFKDEEKRLEERKFHLLDKRKKNK